ncbi:hypothetical protein [Streptomyces sp. NPDC048643]|uniref:hypothetical protein n=1 Tax=Streptomyces sp. NPDC048643 TaxID=3155637 RepID=UPI003428CB6A
MNQPPGGSNFNFNAWGNSWQFGVVHGDVFIPGPHATPQENFEAGVRDLTSHNRLSALRLLDKAFSAGRTSERAYYLMLAVLSDQPYELLGPKDMERLHQAAAFATDGGRSQSQESPEHYGTAIHVILQLLVLVSKGSGASEEGEGVFSFRAAVEALPEARRSEFMRHLQMIMSGAIRDRLDAADAALVREKRRANARETRAPKFFLPDPVEPKQRIAVPAGLTTTDQVALAAAAVLGVLGYVLALSVLFQGRVATALFVTFSCCGGGALAVWYGMERRWLSDRLTEEDGRHFPAGSGPQQWGQLAQYGAVPFNVAVVPGAYRIAWPHQQFEKFHTDVTKIISTVFALQPYSGEDPSAWNQHSAGVRMTLANELTIAYGGTHNTVGLEWLVLMHAQEAVYAWRNGTLFDYRRRLRVPVHISLAFWAGIICFGIGALTGAVDLLMIDAGAGLGAALLLAGAGVLTFKAGYAVFAKRRTHAADLRSFGSRYATELQVWRQWRDFLSDRPTDNEMAQWLDYDLRALRRESLEHYGLTHYDVRTYLFVTEAAPGCIRARARCGPPRYSSYIIRLFLLTEGGVRQHEWTMDFGTAQHSKEDRTTFRYDAIGSVAVTQVGIRGLGDRRRVVPLDTDTVTSGVRPQDEVILSQALRLSLLNSETIHIVVENFHDFLGRIKEDPQYLYQLALDSSGVSTALRILESVAAEGRGWFDAQRASLHRRLRSGSLMGSADFGAAGAGRPALNAVDPGNHSPDRGHTRDREEDPGDDGSRNRDG